MNVKIKYFANFREITGKSEEQMEIQKNSTIKNVLDKVIEEHPDLEQEIFEDNELSDYVNILVDRRNILDRNGLDTKISSNDTIAIFPPISGG
ncbi:molybdopterin synthase sulfur carrier subunit [archaeon SCG-AAA382B04]|nr:molybdopterin synthase sulfur carrier subunit [archaeon SCG-AAA382B04]